MSYRHDVFDTLDPYEQFEILDHHYNAWAGNWDFDEIYEELEQEYGEDAIFENEAA